MQQSSAKFDISQQRFGLLTALEPISGKNSSARWRCRCDCGKETSVLYRELAYGKTRSCGCARMGGRIRDLTGQRFGRLLAQQRLPAKKDGSYLWRCLCDCGKTAFVPASALTKGQTRSCGCLARDSRSAAALSLEGTRFGKLTVLTATGERDARGSVVWRCRCDCGQETLQSANALRAGRVTSCGCVRRQNDALLQGLGYIDNTCAAFLRQGDKPSVRNTSGYRGVVRRGEKWMARITFQKKTYYLGTYPALEDAVRVRKKAEEVLFGEFLEWYDKTFPPKRAGREELTNE